MGKYCLVLVAIIFGTSSAFASITTPVSTTAQHSPVQTYQALVDSYATIPLLQEVVFPVAGQEGRMSFYINNKENPGERASILVWYNSVSNAEAKQGKVDLVAQGIIYDQEEAFRFESSLSVLIDNQKIYIKVHSLNLTSSAEENEDIMIAQMFIESLIGQWIMFDTQAQEGIRPLGEAGFGSQEEIVQKILALLTDAELFTIGREISPGIFSISLNKEMVKQIVEVAGKTVDATDLSEINVQGTINNDLANPVVSIGRSHLDATTIIRARRTKERFVLNMTDRLIGLDSTMTFAKKLNGIGFSYKDSSKTTVDVSYFLNNLISTMRATIVIEDDTMIRMNMKGRYFDAAGSVIAIPTDVIVLADFLTDLLEIE